MRDANGRTTGVTRRRARCRARARTRRPTIVASRRRRDDDVEGRREDGRREGRRPARATRDIARTARTARGRRDDARGRRDDAGERRWGEGSRSRARSARARCARRRRRGAFIDLPSRLHNRYFFVRHGESVLDVRNGGMILSNPSFKYDTTFGLTARGRAQMQEAAKTILRDFDGAPAWLYTSNFSAVVSKRVGAQGRDRAVVFADAHRV